MSQLVGLTLDTTLPTNSLSLVNISPAGNAYLSGTTLWYKGNNGGGTFQIENAVGDNESGPASSVYANLGNPKQGWTFTGTTVSDAGLVDLTTQHAHVVEQHVVGADAPHQR